MDTKNKTAAQLDKERTEAEAKAAEERQRIEQERADIKVRDAETALERAERDADLAEPPKKGGGTIPKSAANDMVEEQIEHGKAPIAPGPEKPVDLEDAAEAKTNRGRGLGG